MRIVSNGVQPYIVQTGVDTDGETQEEVTTFRMKLDVSEWLPNTGTGILLSICGAGVPFALCLPWISSLRSWQTVSLCLVCVHLLRQMVTEGLITGQQISVCVSQCVCLAHLPLERLIEGGTRHREQKRLFLEENTRVRPLNNNKAGESHAAKMRIVSNGVQPYIVQTGVDTDGETQEEVTTFRMKLDVSEWVSGCRTLVFLSLSVSLLHVILCRNDVEVPEA
ncbi:hypothetical protein DPX16_9593 [Anabarilius grahami]|uniref:Uncharacterized protein n=1 Tax=Anabarilius grahami TaxID=495550 RepID=A0A3N0Z6E1_ANAGA|nr:hypothetical protein DPX16_9593 [Anabarilius grahami]